MKVFATIVRVTSDGVRVIKYVWIPLRLLVNFMGRTLKPGRVLLKVLYWPVEGGGPRAYLKISSKS